MTGDQGYVTTMLGNSEILSIKHSPKSHIPAVRKGPDDCLKVSAMVDSEQINDVLKDHSARLYFLRMRMPSTASEGISRGFGRLR